MLSATNHIDPVKPFAILSAGMDDRSPPAGKKSREEPRQLSICLRKCFSQKLNAAKSEWKKHRSENQ